MTTRHRPDSSGWNNQVGNASPAYSLLRAAQIDPHPEEAQPSARPHPRAVGGADLEDLQQLVVLVEEPRPYNDEVAQPVRPGRHVAADEAGFEIVGHDDGPLPSAERALVGR